VPALTTRHVPCDTDVRTSGPADTERRRRRPTPTPDTQPRASARGYWEPTPVLRDRSPASLRAQALAFQKLDIYIAARSLIKQRQWQHYVRDRWCVDQRDERRRTPGLGAATYWGFLTKHTEEVQTKVSRRDSDSGETRPHDAHRPRHHGEGGGRPTNHSTGRTAPQQSRSAGAHGGERDSCGESDAAATRERATHRSTCDDGGDRP